MRVALLVRTAAFVAVTSCAFGSHAAPTLDEFRAEQDRRLAERWAAGDVDAVLDGVDEIYLRLPQEPLARVWLAVVCSAEGLPETAAAFGTAAAKTVATSTGARVLAEEQSRRLRTTEVTISGPEGAVLSPADKATLERGVRAWLGRWATAPEQSPASSSPRLQRALALAGAMPRGAAVVDVRWQGAALMVRVGGGARIGVIPDLDVKVSSAFAPLFVAGRDLSAATTPVALQLQQQVKVVLTGAEPDEQLTIGGQIVSVVDGHTAELVLPRRARITRKLGTRERNDDVQFVAGSQEVALAPWPELAQARERFGVAWNGAALTNDEATLLQSLCDQTHGAAAERLLDGLLGPERGFIRLIGLQSGAKFVNGTEPVPVLFCRGKSWVGLARGDDDVVLTVEAGRTLTIRAADRAAGERKLAARVRLTAKDKNFQYRISGAKEWRSLDVPIEVAPETSEVLIDVARPLKALQPRLRLKPPLGDEANLALAEQETGVRADAVVWEELQARRQTGWWLFAVPISLAAVGGGLIGGGAVVFVRAGEAAAAYEATTSKVEAVTQRQLAEGRVSSANLLTQVGVGALGLAAVSTALPALWLLVLNPAQPFPADFPAE
jgi:hypothetical protein